MHTLPKYFPSNGLVRPEIGFPRRTNDPDPLNCRIQLFGYRLRYHPHKTETWPSEAGRPLTPTGPEGAVTATAVTA